jgi:hypothetical protein
MQATVSLSRNDSDTSESKRPWPTLGAAVAHATHSIPINQQTLEVEELGWKHLAH